jgi:CHAT domain-containing protein/tetratricopeptide (TPR) repeat protein
MTPTPDIHERIRRYLLGQLGDSAREEIEQQIIVDEDLFEELLVAEDELIDEYLSDRLNAGERTAFEQHFLATPERHDKLKFGRAFNRYLSSSSAIVPGHQPIKTPGSWAGSRSLFSSPLRVAILAILVVAVGLGVWRVFFHQSEIDKGLLALNAAYRQQRPVEVRISGLNYAPLSDIRGATADKIDSLSLNRAERILLDEVSERPTPAAHHALGRLFLAERKFDKAIAQFEEALRVDSNNAQIHSDLGAALLELGKADRFGNDSGRGLEELARSLEHLNKALDLNSSLLEALFNRALVHQAMVLPRQAEEDWKKYLEKDPNSRWADEARRHLQDIEQRKKTESQNKAELLPEFVRVAKSHSDDRAYELLSRNTEAIAGQLVWWQLAGAFLDSAAKRESDPATTYLQALAYAGELQERKAGDRFVSELAEFYKSTRFEQQVALAKAHAMIDEAHGRMARSQAAEALTLYTQAKAEFDKAGDRAESLFALYWIGYSGYRESQFKEGLAVLTQLAQRCQAMNYLWLLEKALTMIANIQVESSQFSKSIASYDQSLNISKQINDVYNLQKNLSSLANSYRNLGKRHESLAYTERCLESSESYWSGPRQMYRNYYTTAGVLNSFGYYAAAAEYEKAALQLALDEADPVLENQSYIALAAIYGKLKAPTEALKYADLSHQVATVMDERTRLRPTADSLLQLGHINRQTGNYDKAIASYDEAIRLYDGMKLFAFLYEAHKGRLLGYIAQNNDSRAKEELEIVLALFEAHRSKISEEKNRNSFFDLEQSVYDVAIDFEYSKVRDYQKAFDYSEVSRARSLLDLISTGAEASGDDNPEVVIKSVSQPLTLGGIRERMPEQAQIIQYAVLEDKLLVWLISKTRFEVAEEKIGASSLTAKVLNYSQSLSTLAESDTEESRRAGTELYGILIKPVQSLLEKDKQVYIVPDKILNSLAFNALISPATGKYLVNDYQLSFAPSSNVFLACSEAARQRAGKGDERILSVGDPHFSRTAFPDLPELPSSRQEAERIAGYYKVASLLVGDEARKERVRSEMDRAEVIHLASHYVIDEQNPMLSKLLLTGNAGNGKEETSDGVLQAYEICKRKLPITRLVTLSACRTGVERYYSGEGMIGMSRTFLAAGVPLVVASLWPVASDPTADLMTSFHRYRKRAGLSTSQALRQAQLDMISNGASGHSGPYFWASFVLIGGYASF